MGTLNNVYAFIKNVKQVSKNLFWGSIFERCPISSKNVIAGLRPTMTQRHRDNYANAGGRRSGVRKCSVCCRRESDVFIVSLQQTVHSAILRGSGAQKLILRKRLKLAHRFKFCEAKLERQCTCAPQPEAAFGIKTPMPVLLGKSSA